MIKWEEEPTTMNTVTEILNYIFTAIFAIEAVINLIALGKHYFKDNWNIFDFIVVIVTTVTIIYSQVSVYNFGA